VAREKIGSFIWGKIKAGVWWLKWGKNMQLHLNLKSDHLWDTATWYIGNKEGVYIRKKA
jgi:hypothetical protein